VEAPEHNLGLVGEIQPSVANERARFSEFFAESGMKATFASRSFLGYLAYQSNPAFMAFLISMYFMLLFLLILALGYAVS